MKRSCRTYREQTLTLVTTLHRLVFICVLVLPLQTFAATYLLPPSDQSLVGRIQTVVATKNDTLSDIARRFGIGYDELTLANPDVDPWLPGDGTRVVVPTRHILPAGPREGIVLNVPEMRLYYYPTTARGDVPVVITYPVSIGRGEWETPLGEARIVSKTEDPTWRPPASIRAEHAADGDFLPAVVPPGPDNPLGKFALRLSLPGYLLHGTNRPYGIGMRVTHGCVRLYPEDIETLFDRVPVGTPVRIVHQPYKVGWHVGSLYLETHPPFGDTPQSEPLNLTPLAEALLAVEREWPGYTIDVRQAIKLTRSPTGIPLPIEVEELAQVTP